MRTLTRTTLLLATITAGTLAYNIPTAHAGCIADLEVTSLDIQKPQEIDCLEVEAQGLKCVESLEIHLKNNCDTPITITQTLPTTCSNEQSPQNLCKTVTLQSNESTSQTYYGLTHNQPYAIAYTVLSQDEPYDLTLDVVATIDEEVYKDACSITALNHTTPSPTFFTIAALAIAGTLLTRRRK